MNELQILRIKELDIDIIAPSTDSMHNPDQGGSKIVGTQILLLLGKKKIIISFLKIMI